MAEYLLKGGKMLEKSCKTCGCPLFEVKGKTLCVVCAERGSEVQPQTQTAATEPTRIHHESHSCTCGVDHGDESLEGGLLTEEIAFTIHSLCERIQNEKDPDHVLTLMNAVKAGAEALETLCKL